jgi:peptidoglycan/xylan/chitin deacetylase (PgdA/CDA1 family)
LKGLYLSQRLFARQLAELRRAGYVSAKLSAFNESPFRSASASNSASASTPSTIPSPDPQNQLPASLPPPRIIITFDDGFQNSLDFGIGPLAENNFRAIQFLVADRLGGQNEWDLAEGEAAAALMDEAQVREWLAAGHEIGSHTLTHARLTRLPAAAAREEIGASRKKLEDRFGVPIQHFCYPYGDWNESVRDLVRAAGYQTACTTVPGVNSPEDSPFALKRFTARYPSRNLKAFWARLRGNPNKA